MMGSSWLQTDVSTTLCFSILLTDRRYIDFGHKVLNAYGPEHRTIFILMQIVCVKHLIL